jgi:hypothetical protein
VKTVLIGIIAAILQLILFCLAVHFAQKALDQISAACRLRFRHLPPVEFLSCHAELLPRSADRRDS